MVRFTRVGETSCQTVDLVRIPNLRNVLPRRRLGARLPHPRLHGLGFARQKTGLTDRRYERGKRDRVSRENVRILERLKSPLLAPTRLKPMSRKGLAPAF